MSDFDRNRGLDTDPRIDPRVNPRVDSRMRNDGYGWGLPAIIIAAVLIIGGLWFANAGRDVTTAANDRAPVTRTAPPVAPAPAPATTPAPQSK
jgi:hypothetical protein